MQGLKLLQSSSEDAKDFRCGLQDELLVQDPDFSNKQMKHNRMKFRPFTSHSSYSVEMYGPEPGKLLWIRALEDNGSSLAGCDMQEESRG